MELRKERGQALVETALVFTALITLVLLAIDPAFFLFNHAASAYYSFKAVREASIFLADGYTNCHQEANNAAFGGLGGAPILFMVDSDDLTTWNLALDPCPADSSWSPSSGYSVAASLTWHQKKVFWGEWDGSVSWKDVFQ